ncbi:hypothetical protein D6833_10740, partial [Candidatus Parcubacteria bacterium]
MIAIGLVKGGEVAFTHAFQGLTTGARQTAEQVALDRFSADQKSFHQHSAPSAGLEGFRQYSQQAPGGTIKALEDIAHAEKVHLASTVGNAQGTEDAALAVSPDAPNATVAVSRTARRTAAAEVSQKGGGATALGNKPKEIAKTGAELGYAGGKVRGAEVLADYETLLHQLKEGQHIENPETMSVADLASAIFPMLEAKWHEGMAQAEAKIQAANERGMNLYQFSRLLSYVAAHAEGGKALKAVDLAKALGYKNLGQFYEAAAQGQLARNLITGKGFDVMTKIFGGDRRKAIEALELQAGFDMAQDGFAADAIKERAEKSGDPEGFIRRMK